MGRVCGLSTVVTPAGASINVSKDIFSRKQYKGDDDNVSRRRCLLFLPLRNVNIYEVYFKGVKEKKINEKTLKKSLLKGVSRKRRREY